MKEKLETLNKKFALLMERKIIFMDNLEQNVRDRDKDEYTPEKYQQAQEATIKTLDVLNKEIQTTFAQIEKIKNDINIQNAKTGLKVCEEHYYQKQIGAFTADDMYFFVYVEKDKLKNCKDCKSMSGKEVLQFEKEHKG